MDLAVVFSLQANAVVPVRVRAHVPYRARGVQIKWAPPCHLVPLAAAFFPVRPAVVHFHLARDGVDGHVRREALEAGRKLAVAATWWRRKGRTLHLADDMDGAAWGRVAAECRVGWGGWRHPTRAGNKASSEFS